MKAHRNFEGMEIMSKKEIGRGNEADIMIGDKKMGFSMGVEFNIEPIKQRIRAEYPDAEISILANPRDNVGGVLFIKKAPSRLVEKIGISVDYVMVALDDHSATDILVVPIQCPEMAVPARVSPAVTD